MVFKFFENNKDLSLVIGMVLILIILFAPIPPMFLDLAIIVNFGFALTILLLTFYVKKPVEFSTFPSLLLIATLFRLALNVAATRLILTGADAGEVINSIGSFAVGGNFIVGLVVFSILIVVQYVVVTSGAQRVSEVAARFTLDSMPGQQMSIDADLNMGIIDQKEAIRRRENLEKEASFYGSMDGASKFVKGDAIAGVIIVLIDIIAGWIIGVAQMGMGWGEALETFTLLTIGDGIASQLPALIIAIATGIIVTRSSSDRELSVEVFKQLLSVPRIPLLVAGILCMLLLLPGMPKWPIFLIVGLTMLTWYRIRRRRSEEAEDVFSAEQDEAEDVQLSRAAPLLELVFGPDLIEAWKDSEAQIMERITNLRQTHESNLGLGFPAVKIVEGSQLSGFTYELKLFGTRYASGTIRPEKQLAIKSEKTKTDLPGIATHDPAFGLPAIWIENDLKQQAQDADYTLIDPITVLITHMDEILKEQASALLTRAVTVKLLEEVRERQGGLVEELIPNLLSISDIQRILQNLLSESVSIGNVDLIFEYLVDLARTEKDVFVLTEQVRQKMSYSICNQLQGRHDDLAVISLDPRIENKIQTNLTANPGQSLLALDPQLAQTILGKLSKQVDAMIRDGRSPVLLCGPDIRRHFRLFTQRSAPRLSIISVSEIPNNINLKSFDIIDASA